jgi:hypothetical protein
VTAATPASPAARFFGGMLQWVGGTIAFLALTMSLFLLVSAVLETTPAARLTGIFAVVMFGLIPCLIGLGLFLLGRKLRGGREVRPREADRAVGKVLLVSGAIVTWIGAHMAVFVLGVGNLKGDDDPALDALVGFGIVPGVIGIGLMLGGWLLSRRWRRAHLAVNPRWLDPRRSMPASRASCAVLVGVGGLIAAPMAFVVLSGLAETLMPIGPDNPLLLGAALYSWYRPFVWLLLCFGLELVIVGSYRHRYRSVRAGEA